MPSRASGLLRTTLALEAKELRPEVAIFLAPGGPGALDKRGLEPWSAFAQAGVLRALETYATSPAALLIDSATARHCEEPISTAPTESTVQWLLHRRMAGNQQMRWSPRGAHLMLKARTSLANGTFGREHAIAER